MSARVLHTIKEAAEAMGVSERHVRGLIQEADLNKKSRWKFGREIVDLSPVQSAKRTLRINLQAVLPSS